MSVGVVKRCQAYLQRASELEQYEPVVAHYCRVFAVEQLVKARQTGEATAESNKLLMDQMVLSEASKQALDLSQGRETIESFAMSVFDAADTADREGQRDANLPGHFYAAALFLEVCEQFHGGELPPDLVEKVRYAKYRAVHLRSCLQQGLEPSPPAGSGSTVPDPGADSNEPRPTVDPPPAAPVPAPTGPAGAALPDPAAHRQQPIGTTGALGPGVAAPTAAAPALTVAPAAATAKDALGKAAPASGHAGAIEAKLKVQRASSALDFNDVATARSNLLEALQLLGESY